MSAESSPTRADLLERVHEAYREFSEAIADVPPDMLTTAGTCGAWSVRDVMAHVGADEQWMAGQLEALLSGELPTALSCYGSDTPPPPEMDWSQDGRNAWQHERLRALSLDDVRALANEGHARLLAAIESFSDEQLSEELGIAQHGTTSHVRPRKDGEDGWPLWEWLRGVTYNHYADHVGAIGAVGARRAPAPSN